MRCARHSSLTLTLERPMCRILPSLCSLPSALTDSSSGTCAILRSCLERIPLILKRNTYPPVRKFLTFRRFSRHTRTHPRFRASKDEIAPGLPPIDNAKGVLLGTALIGPIAYRRRRRSTGSSSTRPRQMRDSANGGRLANGRHAQAEPQKTADGVDELGHRDRLRQISLATAFTDTLFVALHRKGGHRDYRNGLEFGIFLQPLGHFETGDFRQLNVHHDHIRTVFAGEIGPLEAVARADGTIAVSFQQVAEELHVELVILHDHYCLRHLSPRRAAGRLPGLRTAHASADPLRKRKQTTTFATNTRAREEQADHYFQEMIKIADEPLKDNVEAARARNRIDVRKFAVSRLAPKKYGDCVSHDVQGNTTFNVQPAVATEIL